MLQDSSRGVPVNRVPALPVGSERMEASPIAPVPFAGRAPKPLPSGDGSALGAVRQLG